LVTELDHGLVPPTGSEEASLRSQWLHYLAAMDQLTRRVFVHNV
jgi:hypothetical protein